MQNLNQGVMDSKRTLSEAKDASEKVEKDALSGLSGDDIKQLASQLIDELTDFLDDRKEDFIGVKKKCQNQIKENPIITIVGALATGALIGMFIKK